MNMRRLDPDVTAKWESGVYGRSEEHVGVASEEEFAALDSDLAMKLISIRLPVPLINALKTIAEYHGIAYQPMIRDLLGRFARSEIKQIAAELETKIEQAQARSDDESSPPVESFIERTKVAAAGGM